MKIESYDDPAIAGQSNQITIEIGSNTDVFLYVEFKGEFSWGHWIFGSCEIQVEEGLSMVSCDVDVPYKTIIEPASNFYFYVYVTLQGDSWGSSVWGLIKTVTVEPPSDVSHEELVAYMSHLKWLVDTSSLSKGIRDTLFSNLEAAGNDIDTAYGSLNLNELQGAICYLNSFINIIGSDSEAATYPDSTLWMNQANYIIDRMQIVVN